MTLVGIMPPRFQIGEVDLWMPLDIKRDMFVPGAGLVSNEIWTIGHLKTGVSPQAAAAWTLHCKAMRYRFRWMLVRVKAKREVLTAESTTTGKNWAPFVFFKSPTCAIPVVGKVGSPVAPDTGST